MTDLDVIGIIFFVLATAGLVWSIIDLRKRKAKGKR